LIRDVWFDLGSLAGTSIAHDATMEMFFVPQLVGGPNPSFNSKYWPPVPAELINGEVADCITRSIARSLVSNERIDVAPIYEQPMSEVITAYYALGRASRSTPIADIADVALKMLPVPDDTCAWQDILDFKSEMRDKLWHFRRFLHDLAMKKKTEAEIRDDIEWSLNEYTRRR
jgi:hypothetical protein